MQIADSIYSTPAIRPAHYLRYALSLLIVHSPDIQPSVNPPFLRHLNPKLENKRPVEQASLGY
jgi:hypothetical protein